VAERLEADGQVAAPDAKAKFSKVVDDAVAKGPQIVTKRGVETAW